MAPNRPDDFPSLLFVHNDHEFIITTVPDGADVLLHIADQYGRLLLPVSPRVVGANASPGGRLNHRLIGIAMAELRRSVKRLASERFLNFLETPRGRPISDGPRRSWTQQGISTGRSPPRRSFTRNPIS
jgi:hypothetical protein